MKVKSVEFVKSVDHISQIPRAALKEIAIAGRSNVGKSSLINCLLNRKKIAKTSSSPGKTRLLNYFQVNHQFYIVDLPGYGFAKVSKQERERWKNLIESFLTHSQHLKGVISIIDSRIGATKLDLQLLDWLKELNQHIIIVATKSDKLSKSSLSRQLSRYSDALASYTDSIIPFSAIKGSGKAALWREINILVG